MIDNENLVKFATEVANKAHDIIDSDDVQDIIIVLCLAAVMLAKTYDIADDSIRELIDTTLTDTTATRISPQ